MTAATATPSPSLLVGAQAVIRAIDRTLSWLETRSRTLDWTATYQRTLPLMADDIDSPENYVAGESATLEVTITENGSAKDIKGSSVDWWLLPNRGADTSEATLSTSDSGVSAALTTDGTDGRLDVSIDQGTTDGLGGTTYWQLLTVDDTGPGLQKWRGNWYIEVP